MAYHDDVIINVSQPDKLDPKDGFVSVDIEYDREALFKSFMLDDKDEWWIDAQETKTNTFLSHPIREKDFERHDTLKQELDKIFAQLPDCFQNTIDGDSCIMHLEGAGTDLQIHTDGGGRDCVIVFPVYGKFMECSTAFYHIPYEEGFQWEEDKMNDVSSYDTAPRAYPMPRDFYDCSLSFTYDSPHILETQIPHDATNPSDSHKIIMNIRPNYQMSYKDVCEAMKSKIL